MILLEKIQLRLSRRLNIKMITGDQIAIVKEVVKNFYTKTLTLLTELL
jgi:hypothetical protein